MKVCVNKVDSVYLKKSNIDQLVLLALNNIDNKVENFINKPTGRQKCPMQ